MIRLTNYGATGEVEGRAAAYVPRSRDYGVPGRSAALYQDYGEPRRSAAFIKITASQGDQKSVANGGVAHRLRSFPLFGAPGLRKVEHAARLQ